MSVELDYSTFVLLPGAVNPPIGMMMETDVWGTTIIVRDKQDGAPKQKLSATASEFVSSWDVASEENEDKAGADDDGGVDYFDQQEQDELLHVPLEPDARNDTFSSYENETILHLLSRRDSLDGGSYNGSRHSSRSSSPSPKNNSSLSDPFSHFANVSNPQLLHPHAQSQQRLRQPQLPPQSQQQILLQPVPLSQSSRQAVGRMQPFSSSSMIQATRSHSSNGGLAAPASFAQRFQPPNVPPPAAPQSPPARSLNSDPRTLRPPVNRNFYRPPRESGIRPQTVPNIRGRISEPYGWIDGY